MRFALVLAAALLFTACGSRTESPQTVPTVEEASVRFVRPLPGDTVSNPVALVMEVRGLTLLPAGEMVEGAGHLHVLVDTLFVEAGTVIPKNDNHLHYGDARTEAEVTLEPGEHVLRLQFGDGAHVALAGPQYRDEIRIVVR